MFCRFAWLAALVLKNANHRAEADVVERDRKESGDALLTFDDVNRREWLDLTETLCQRGTQRFVCEPIVSFEDVLTELDVEGRCAGFSVASVEDVYGLAASAGINATGSEWSVENVEPVTQLQSLVGVTDDGSWGAIWSEGIAWWNDSDSFKRVWLVVSKLPPHDRAGFSDSGDAFTLDDGNTERTPVTGVWLFRPASIHLQPGDADQNLVFDQSDLVQVQVAGKYLTGRVSTWGEGDWNGAPGGAVGTPPAEDGVFNQLDIVAAQQAGLLLAGPYASVQANSLASVPEPSSLLLLAVGLFAAGCRRCRARMD